MTLAVQLSLSVSHRIQPSAVEGFDQKRSGPTTEPCSHERFTSGGRSFRIFLRLTVVHCSVSLGFQNNFVHLGQVGHFLGLPEALAPNGTTTGWNRGWRPKFPVWFCEWCGNTFWHSEYSGHRSGMPCPQQPLAYRSMGPTRWAHCTPTKHQRKLFGAAATMPLPKAGLVLGRSKGAAGAGANGRISSRDTGTTRGSDGAEDARAYEGTGATGAKKAPG